MCLPTEWCRITQFLLTVLMKEENMDLHKPLDIIVANSMGSDCITEDKDNKGKLEILCSKPEIRYPGYK